MINLCCKYILEHINIISHQVCQDDFRYVLYQRYGSYNVKYTYVPPTCLYFSTCRFWLEFNKLRFQQFFVHMLCQHFVDNNEFQPPPRLPNSGSTFSRSTATMAAHSRFPDSQVTNPGMTLDNTLRELSVSATLLTNRADNEY